MWIILEALGKKIRKGHTFIISETICDTFNKYALQVF